MKKGQIIEGVIEGIEFPNKDISMRKNGRLR